MEAPPDVFLEAAQALNSLRLEGKLCDATLVVEEHRFPVHRAIMATVSPYFKALFTNGMKETGKSEIIIPNIPPEVLQTMIEYAYTRKIEITSENVEIVLPYADQFHVTGITKACCDYLEQSLQPDNCVGIYKFADSFYLSNLASIARNYLLRNFHEVGCHSNELLQLEFEEFSSILNDDHINVRFEEDLFTFVCRWVEVAKDERFNYLPDLLRCIRLGLIHLDYFVAQIVDHTLVKENEQCSQLISEAWQFLLSLENDDGKRKSLDSSLIKPRIPHEIIFATGGWTGGSPTTFLESYDTRADRWFTQPYTADRTPRAYHGCVALSGLVYVLGGFDGTVYFNSVRSFNPVTKLWQEAAPMYKQRCYVSTTAAEGHIFALGGFDGRERLQSAEKYSPVTNQWSCIADMLSKRSDASAAYCGGTIYVGGGFDGQECLDTAETYDLTTNEWTAITPMREKRSGVSLVSYRGAIHAIGGFNGWHRLGCGERYNPDSKNWTPIKDMYTARSNFATVVLDSMIFVIGGFNGATTVAHVECYDGDVDDWYDATDMNINRSALAACVIGDIPNIKEYTFYGHQQKADEGETMKNQSSPNILDKLICNNGDVASSI